MADGSVSTTQVPVHVGEFQEEGGVVLTSVDSIINWARKNSIWPLPLGLSCCAIEFMATAASRFDMARFGAMMLDDGVFAGRRLVPRGYARAATSTQLSTNGGFTPGYGFLWWIASRASSGGGLEIPLALGNGGQQIAIDRATRTVVVITAGAYDRPEQGRAPAAVVAGVLGAIRTP